MDDTEDERFESAEQFIARIKHIVDTPYETHEDIDDALRAFIAAAISFHRDFEVEGDETQYGCFELLESGLFRDHRDYVRQQFIHSLDQEDDYPVLQIMTTFLLYDGKLDEETFVLMQNEGMFARLLELIKSGRYDDTVVHNLLLELLCEVTRVQQLSREQLQMVDDAFVLYLFQRIEQLSQDATDPYHFAIIRILLIVNEQYMCVSQDDTAVTTSVPDPVPNRIIKILSTYGPAYRTFGENLILLLNRQTELGPQLLILKVLYLLFTTAQTYEYFYTNDLHVLVDVIMRNLLDLDDDNDDSPITTSEGSGQRALRHTYLRVLHALLKNTQLARTDPPYKKPELQRFLKGLVSSSSAHFHPVDATVARLVNRCRQIDWLADPDAADEPVILVSPVADTDVAKKLLGMSHIEANLSHLSMLDVAARVEKEERKERPVAPPPRRGRKPVLPEKTEVKVKPVVPKPRRARSGIKSEGPFGDSVAD